MLSSVGREGETPEGMEEAVRSMRAGSGGGAALLSLLTRLPAGVDEDVLGELAGPRWEDAMAALCAARVFVARSVEHPDSHAAVHRVWQPASAGTQQRFCACVVRTRSEGRQGGDGGRAEEEAEEERLVSFFVAKCEQVRRSWLGTGSAVAVLWFKFHEPNIWAVLSPPPPPPPSSCPSPPSLVCSLAMLAANFSCLLRLAEKRERAGEAALLGIDACRQQQQQQQAAQEEALAGSMALQQRSLGEATCHLALCKSLAEQRLVRDSLAHCVAAMVHFHQAGNARGGYGECLLMLARHLLWFGPRPVDAVDALGRVERKQAAGDAAVRADLALSPVRMLERALDLTREDALLQGDVSLTLSRVAPRHLPAHSQPEALLQRARALYVQCGDLFGQAEAVKQLARVQWRRDQRDHALHSLRLALTLYSRCNLPVACGNVQRMLGEYEAEVAGEAMAADAGAASPERLARSAMAHLSAARELFRSLGRSHGEASCLEAMGELHFRVCCHARDRGEPGWEAHEASALGCLRQANQLFEDRTPQAQKLNVRACAKLVHILTAGEGARDARRLREATVRLGQAERLLARLDGQQGQDTKELALVVDRARQHLVRARV